MVFFMKVSELGLKAADSIENQQSPYRSGAQKRCSSKVSLSGGMNWTDGEGALDEFSVLALFHLELV
jgi:hypothetical protein